MIGRIRKITLTLPSDNPTSPVYFTRFSHKEQKFVSCIKLGLLAKQE